MAVLEKLEFVPFGPYRFIGKSVYARIGGQYSGVLFGALWEYYSKSVFQTLDQMQECATQETENVALISGDLYEEKKKLLGYTIGRFMRADTPVPDGLDSFDVPAIYVAKGIVRGEFDDMIENAEKLMMDAISRQAEYTATWAVAAEVYTAQTVTQTGAHSVLGYYIGCKKA